MADETEYAEREMTTRKSTGGKAPRGRAARKESVNAYIYKMSWYDSRRHRTSHTDMYFLREEDTIWGFDDPNCRIHFVRVCDQSQEYWSARHNSEHGKRESVKKPPRRRWQDYRRADWREFLELVRMDEAQKAATKGDAPLVQENEEKEN
jgi:hypothetical protein